MTPDDQRALLELSFEPSGEDYVYYRNRWSQGVPVSVAEREAYLKTAVFGSRAAWHKSIANRQLVPPRPYFPVLRKLLATMPLSMAASGLLFGLIGLTVGIAEPRLVWAVLWLLGGFLMSVFAVSIILAHATKPKEPD